MNGAEPTREAGNPPPPPQSAPPAEEERRTSSGILKLDPTKPKRRSSVTSIDIKNATEDPASPCPSDRLSVTWADGEKSLSSDASVTTRSRQEGDSENPSMITLHPVFSPMSPFPVCSPPMSPDGPSSFLRDPELDNELDASVAVILRRSSTKRKFKKKMRRKSTITSQTSGETKISLESESDDEKVKLFREVLAGVKHQPWPIKKKLYLARLSKDFLAKHEGELKERLAQSKSTKDVLLHYFIRFRGMARISGAAVYNWATSVELWQGRVKKIESHFGSAVASYFTFLRWVLALNAVIVVLLAAFVIVPESLAGEWDSAGERKHLLEEEQLTSYDLKVLWVFEGILRYSPLFYGFYGKNRETKEGYKLPLAYILTSMCVYGYSFVAILRKMAANSRMSKLGDYDETGFTFRIFAAWDFSIGGTEAAQNKVASINMGFREALLDAREADKAKKSWKVSGRRGLAHVLVLCLLVGSAYGVVLLVERSKEVSTTASSSWWRQNELSVVLTLISQEIPSLFALIGRLEDHHPRKQLQWQLARIMVLNLLNLYTLIFALFGKVKDMSVELTSIQEELMEAYGGSVPMQPLGEPRPNASLNGPLSAGLTVAATLLYGATAVSSSYWSPSDVSTFESTATSETPTCRQILVPCSTPLPSRGDASLLVVSTTEKNIDPSVLFDQSEGLGLTLIPPDLGSSLAPEIGSNLSPGSKLNSSHEPGLNSNLNSSHEPGLNSNLNQGLGFNPGTDPNFGLAQDITLSLSSELDSNGSLSPYLNRNTGLNPEATLNPKPVTSLSLNKSKNLDLNLSASRESDDGNQNSLIPAEGLNLTEPMISGRVRNFTVVNKLTLSLEEGTRTPPIALRNTTKANGPDDESDSVLSTMRPTSPGIATHADDDIPASTEEQIQATTSTKATTTEDSSFTIFPLRYSELTRVVPVVLTPFLNSFLFPSTDQWTKQPDYLETDTTALEASKSKPMSRPFREFASSQGGGRIRRLYKREDMAMRGERDLAVDNMQDQKSSSSLDLDNVTLYDGPYSDHDGVTDDTFIPNHDVTTVKTDSENVSTHSGASVFFSTFTVVSPSPVPSSPVSVVDPSGSDVDGPSAYAKIYSTPIISLSTPANSLVSPLHSLDPTADSPSENHSLYPADLFTSVEQFISPSSVDSFSVIDSTSSYTNLEFASLNDNSSFITSYETDSASSISSSFGLLEPAEATTSSSQIGKEGGNGPPYLTTESPAETDTLRDIPPGSMEDPISTTEFAYNTEEYPHYFESSFGLNQDCFIAIDVCDDQTKIENVNELPNDVNITSNGSLTNETDSNASESYVVSPSFETTVQSPETLESLARHLPPTNRSDLRKLCWETMFGQEIVKLTVMDLIQTVTTIVVRDYIRAVVVRAFSKNCCWDLEKQFPGYPDFDIAENILHLVYNQGLVWMGMFFSPGLPAINMVKLLILMYVRSWAVLTSNVPPETVFKASDNNNFYLALLLIMLFLCTLPVGYAVVWLTPSWHCGPFSDKKKIYQLATETLISALPPSFEPIIDYISSPGVIIPGGLLLILIIYYLISLTAALREAVQDLKDQLRSERDARKKKALEAHSNKVETPTTRWARLLQQTPLNPRKFEIKKRDSDKEEKSPMWAERQGKRSISSPAPDDTTDLGQSEVFDDSLSDPKKSSREVRSETERPPRRTPAHRGKDSDSLKGDRKRRGSQASSGGSLSRNPAFGKENNLVKGESPSKMTQTPREGVRHKEGFGRLSKGQKRRDSPKRSRAPNHGGPEDSSSEGRALQASGGRESQELDKITKDYPELTRGSPSSGKKKSKVSPDTQASVRKHKREKSIMAMSEFHNGRVKTPIAKKESNGSIKSQRKETPDSPEMQTIPVIKISKEDSVERSIEQAKLQRQAQATDDNEQATGGVPIDPRVLTTVSPPSKSGEAQLFETDIDGQMIRSEDDLELECIVEAEPRSASFSLSEHDKEIIFADVTVESLPSQAPLEDRQVPRQEGAVATTPRYRSMKPPPLKIPSAEDSGEGAQ